MTSDRFGQRRNVVDISSARSSATLAVSPAELRARWRSAATEAGWSFAGDWWVPAVDAVTESICAGADPRAPVQRLGLARADAGVDMNEALVDIEALWRVLQYLDLSVQPLQLAAFVHAAAIGWAEQSDLQLRGTPCEDPLTALASAEYLATRLGEVYRQGSASGRSVARSHALVVVSLMDAPPVNLWVEPDPTATWDAAMHMVLVSEAMHRVFSAGETIAEIRPTTAVALVTRDQTLPVRVSLLRELIERDRLSGAGQRKSSVGVWVEGLPSALRPAVQLLRELGR